MGNVIGVDPRTVDIPQDRGPLTDYYVVIGLAEYLVMHGLYVCAPAVVDGIINTKPPKALGQGTKAPQCSPPCNV